MNLGTAMTLYKDITVKNVITTTTFFILNNEPNVAVAPLDPEML